MSGGRRKRNSKWDLKEDSQLSHEKVRDSAWPGKAGISYHEKESRPGRFSPKVAGYNNVHKWSGREADDILSSKHDLQSSYREPLLGSRGLHRDDSIDDYQEDFKATATWDGEGSYNMRMSPGVDDWRHQIRRRSPKNDWSRHHRNRSRSRSRSGSRSRSHSWNQSRSPVRGFGQESDVYGRKRGRPGVLAPLCKDFAAGRCRRGSHCHFSHHSSHSYEDSWESRHRETRATKYSTPRESREYPMRSGRNREGSLERRGEHESRKSSDIPCKFFTAGNCRNGKYCRFSHSGQALASPNRRSRDDSLVRGHNSDDTDKLWNGPKWDDANTFTDARLSEEKNERMGANRKSQDDRLLQHHNSDSVEKLWDGPTWSGTDTFADAAKLSENQNDRMGVPGPRFSAWSREDRLPHSLDENAAHANQTAVSHEGESNKIETIQCKIKNAGEGMGASDSGGTENWLGDMEMSPDWNYTVKSSNCAMNKDHVHIPQSLHPLPISDTSLLCEQRITREASAVLHDPVTTMQPMIMDKSYLKLDVNQRDNGAVALPCGDKNAIGKTAISAIDLNFSSNILPTQSFDQNVQSSSALPFTSFNSIGQSQGAIASEPSRGGNINNPQNHTVFQVEKSSFSSILPTQSFDQNVQSSSALPFTSFNSVGQSEGAIAFEPSRGGNINNPQNHTVFQVEKSSNKPGIGDGSASQFSSGVQPTQNMVSSEQLTQLTNLSASLVQFLGNGQQLPQLYAALNTHNVMQVPSSSNSEGPIPPDSTVTNQPNEAIRSEKQYDPLCDSVESKKCDVVNIPGSSINPTGQKSNADRKPNGGSGKTIDKSQLPKQLESDANLKVSGIRSGVEAEEDKMAQIENTIPEENGKAQKTDEDGNDDNDDKEDKAEKSKDTKGLRSFKFALAEFVKELLKPAWKEGQINKDAHKNIVKKVVDKVIGTMQGAANIPQTQEKIDQYLSFSKSKISKLVQAYVEKFRKG